MVRAHARHRRVGSLGFWLALVVLGGAAVGVRLSTTDRGQALLVRYGVTKHFLPQLATRLDVALARRLLDMGLVRGNLKAREVVENGRRVREYRFAAPQHLTPTQCHVMLRQAARGVDADVVHAEEHHQRGDELVLWIGFGSSVTHRVVVTPPKPLPATTARDKHGPRIALVIDDFGNNMNATTRGFLDLGVPFTMAVLPDLTKSKAAFEAAKERGLPVLLHLPMQPDGDENPGKNPITVDMSPEQIDALVDEQVRRYPAILGVNNHMGSRATADRGTMRSLMQTLRRHELFFVDSVTTPRSLGAQESRSAGVWCLRNDLFLDDKEEPVDEVAANLERLAAIARRRGLAIGIAHPHPETLEALRAVIPRLQAEGIEFITVLALRPQPREVAQPGTS